jgi:uncharacterized protein YjbJ (UPF0337 family)
LGLAYYLQQTTSRIRIADVEIHNPNNLLTKHGGRTMNWDQIEGNWKQMKGKVKEKWGKLTDDDLDVAAGKKDQLVGKLQERYGWEKDKAEKEADLYFRGI